MKKLLILSMLVLSGCSFQRIGNLTMVSTRNVDSSTNYVELKRNVTGTSKMRKGDALQEAIDEAVSSVPGGEYMMNAVFYVKDNRVIKVVGDVYGDPANASKYVVENELIKEGNKIHYLDHKNRKVLATILEVKGDSSLIQIDLNKKELTTHNKKIFK